MGKQRIECGKARISNAILPNSENVCCTLSRAPEGVDKFDARWERGCFLGVRDESAEVIIGTCTGVVKARNFKRLGSLEERWNKDALLSVVGTPWEPVPGKQSDALPVRIKLPEEGSAPDPVNLGEPAPEIRRRARITRADVLRFGFTQGCPGCTAISRGAVSQNHTEMCRARIEEELLKQGGE